MPATNRMRPAKYLGQFALAAAAWLRRNLREALLAATIGFAIGYVVNVLLMLFYYDGYGKTGAGPATGQDNVANAMLIWCLGSAVVFGLVSHARKVGRARFVDDLRLFPQRIIATFRGDSNAVWIHSLWGFAVSLLASQFISPWASATVAAVLLSTTLTPFGRILASVLVRLWMALAREFAPVKRSVRGPAGLLVGIMTASLGLAASFFITGAIEKWAGAVFCAGFAIYLSRKPGRGAPPLAPLLLAFLLLAPLIALADDGGFQEARGGLVAWISGGGGTPLLAYGLYGGAAASLGALLGNLFVAGNAELPLLDDDEDDDDDDDDDGETADDGSEDDDSGDGGSQPEDDSGSEEEAEATMPVDSPVDYDRAIRQIMLDFENRQSDLKDRIEYRLQDLQAFNDNYNTQWVRAMTELDAYGSTYRHLVPDMEKIWDAISDHKLGRKIADWTDTTLAAVQVAAGGYHLVSRAAAGESAAVRLGRTLLGDAAADAGQVERGALKAEQGALDAAAPKTVTRTADPFPDNFRNAGGDPSLPRTAGTDDAIAAGQRRPGIGNTVTDDASMAKAKPQPPIGGDEPALVGAENSAKPKSGAIGAEKGGGQGVTGGAIGEEAGTGGAGKSGGGGSDGVGGKGAGGTGDGGGGPPKSSDPSGQPPKPDPSGRGSSDGLDPSDIKRPSVRNPVSDDLMEQPGMNPLDMHVHHLLPQEFDAFFESHGLNIEDPRFKIPLNAPEHVGEFGVHGNWDGLRGENWNSYWREFIDEADRSGRQLTQQDIIDKLNSMGRYFIGEGWVPR